MSGILSIISPGLVSSAFAATAVPTIVSGQRSWVGSVQTDEASTCSAVNGAPPYTYSWTYVSGDTSVYPTSPTDATTRFFSYFGSVALKIAVYKCVVTDSATTTVDTNNVTIELEYT